MNLGYDPAIIESAPGKVGERGRVDGIDMTPEMVAAARTNCEGAGLTNVTVRECSSEELPFDDCSFDVVISNGVINLSPGPTESVERSPWGDLVSIMKAAGLRGVEYVAGTGVSTSKYTSGGTFRAFRKGACYFV